MKVYHKLLSTPGTRYQDLGADYYDHQASNRRQIAHHVGKLGALGFEVTLCRLPEPEPAPPAPRPPDRTAAPASPQQAAPPAAAARPAHVLFSGQLPLPTSGRTPADADGRWLPGQPSTQS